MYRKHSNLATPFRFACVWTLVLQAIGLGLGGYIFFDWRFCALSLPLGWFPLLLIALRRPDRPTTFDIAVMFAGFPVLFIALALFDQWYRHAK